MKVSIYSAYHKLSPRVSSKSIKPIHVGADLASAPLPDMLADNTGNHISGKNGSYCELTALYWAWKNDRDSDFVGLMHYRRLLDVAGDCDSTRAETFVGALDIDDWTARTEAWIETELGNWDIALPCLHKMPVSIEKNFLDAHHAEDFDKMRAVIATDHPAYLDAFDTMASSKTLRLGNIAVMRRDIFDRYCAWLFDILGKIEAADIDRSNYSPYQARYIGFLAERLLTVFILHEQTTNPTLRIRETTILNLSQAAVSPYLTRQDAPADDVVNIAIAADRAYLPHAATMMQSLLTQADPKRPIVLFFLYSDINTEEVEVFGRWLKSQRQNVELHAINAGNYFSDVKRSLHRVSSNATFYRFLLFLLLPGLNRLLYLDVDTILNADVCDLYDADMGDAKVGAVPDWIMTRTLTGPIGTSVLNVPDLSAYLRERLQLSDAQMGRYFNVGVLLMNFKAMGDLKALGEKLIHEAQTQQYLFQDQDILNKEFKDDLHLLDARWNVFNSVDASYAKVPQANHAKAMAARRDPWLVHFADSNFKPWRNRVVPHSDLYWRALVNTPYFGEVTTNLLAERRKNQTLKKSVIDTGQKIAQRYPALNRPLLMVYGLLRRIWKD